MFSTWWCLSLLVLVFIEHSLADEQVKCYSIEYGGNTFVKYIITSGTPTEVAADAGCTKSIEANYKSLDNEKLAEPFYQQWKLYATNEFSNRLPLFCNQSFEYRGFDADNSPYAQKICRCCGNLCNDARMGDACNKPPQFDDYSSTCGNPDSYRPRLINYDMVMRCTASKFCSQPGSVRVAFNLHHFSDPLLLGCLSSPSSLMPKCGSCRERCLDKRGRADVEMSCTCCGEKQCREWNFDRNVFFVLYMLPEEPPSYLADDGNLVSTEMRTPTVRSTPQDTIKSSTGQGALKAMCYSGSSCSPKWAGKDAQGRERSLSNGHCHKRIAVSYNSPTDSAPAAWWIWGSDDKFPCNGTHESIIEGVELGKPTLYYERTCSCCGDLCNDARLDDVCNEVPKIDTLGKLYNNNPSTSQFDVAGGNEKAIAESSKYQQALPFLPMALGIISVLSLALLVATTITLRHSSKRELSPIKSRPLLK